MKVIIFHTELCPHYERALAELHTVLEQEGIRPQVELIEVQDEAQARTLRFLGSPTIRINGLDIEEARREAQPHEFGLACRLYQHNGMALGWPPRAMIREAVRKAKEAEAELEELGYLGGCCG